MTVRIANGRIRAAGATATDWQSVHSQGLLRAPYSPPTRDPSSTQPPWERSIGRRRFPGGKIGCMAVGELIAADHITDWASIEETFAGSGGLASGGALLLGNGFSSNIWSAFGYRTLLEESGLDGMALQLFGDRFNFETVLADLATARQVLAITAPGKTGLLARLDDLAEEVRDALLQTVGDVHPNANRLVVGQQPKGKVGVVGVPVEVLDKLAQYMQRYSKVFMTNYDLISYWAKVRSGMADLFPGADPFDEHQAEVWLATSPLPKMFFLHGALHLWRSLESNAEGKYTAGTDRQLLDVIRESVDHRDRVPLFISEGSSPEKVARISASPYLSFCARALADADAPLTILGQALGDVDRHVCEAIERHPARKVAIGVWVGDIDKSDRDEVLLTRATEIRGRLPKCRDVGFFDSAEHPLTAPGLRAG